MEVKVKNFLSRETRLKTKTMNTDSIMPAANDMCSFFARYSAWLIGCGATCIRLEKNVCRMAAAYGKEVELSIMPRHVHIALKDNDKAEAVTVIASVEQRAVSFNINTRLSELSWELADHKINYEQAKRRFDKIVSSDYQSKLTVLLLVTMANASFCKLFGGDWIAMLIVGIATLAGYYVKQFMSELHADIRLTVLVCSFVSSVLGATGLLFSLGSTPEIALGTSVLYLVPGIPFLNSFSDMLYRHYICAFSRLADALILTCCLSIGLCMGMLLMNVGMF